MQKIPLHESNVIIRRIVPRGANRNSLFAVTCVRQRSRSFYQTVREKRFPFENMPARAGSLGAKRRFERDPKFSGFDGSRTAIAGYTCKSGPRGGCHPRDSWVWNTRGQIRRLYGVPCSSCPPFPPDLCAPPLLLAFPLPLCLSVGHARCIYVDLVAKGRGEGE